MGSGIEFFTGFEGCGQTSDLQSLLDAVYNSSFPAYFATGGFENGKCLRMGSTGGWATKNVSAGKTKTVGFHVNDCSAENYYMHSDSHSLLTFNGPAIKIWNSSAGIDIRRGATNIATVTGVSITSALTHVEIKVFSSATVGTVQIKINGKLVYDGSSLNTDGADITSVTFYPINNANHKLDNIYIANDWQGELVSYPLRPASDSSVAFTPDSGADNYDRVNEAAQDGDTSYVESGTVDHKDLYGYGDIATTVEIKAVTLVTVAKKTDAGARNIQHVVKQGATEYSLEDFALGTAYPAAVGAAQAELLDQAPDESAWTPTILNAMEFGFKVSA